MKYDAFIRPEDFPFGKIRDIKRLANGVDFIIELPNEILHLIAKKGAIAVEGVSLTINDINSNLMRLTLIPISMKDTLFGEFQIGRRVHIESDILARYIDRILNSKNQTLTWQQADFYASIYW